MQAHYDKLEPRYLLRSNGGVQYKRFSHIVCFIADNGYTHVHCKDGASVLTSTKIGEHEKNLEAHPHFMRIHRSYLVNVRYVTAVDFDGTVHLQHGNPVMVSEQHRKALLAVIPTRP